MADDGGSEELPTERIELEPDLAPGMEPEEGSPTRRYVRRSAVEQDSNIPVGWKPTSRKPIPVMRCRHVFKDTHPKAGERCGRWSLRGSELCYIHSGKGNLKNVEEYRLAIVEAARLQLTEAVPDALATLFELAANSPADNVKLKAATEILDRAGLKTAAELNVEVTVTEANPATALAERLQKLKTAADVIRSKEAEAAAAAEAAATAAASSAVLELESGDGGSDEVIEGEIVDD